MPFSKSSSGEIEAVHLIETIPISNEPVDSSQLTMRASDLIAFDESSPGALDKMDTQMLFPHLTSKTTIEHTKMHARMVKRPD